MASRFARQPNAFGYAIVEARRLTSTKRRLGRIMRDRRSREALTEAVLTVRTVRQPDRRHSQRGSEALKGVKLRDVTSSLDVANRPLCNLGDRSQLTERETKTLPERTQPRADSIPKRVFYAAGHAAPYFGTGPYGFSVDTPQE